jgi:tetratricopeptide (TPR) repeat protein
MSARDTQAFRLTGRPGFKAGLGLARRRRMHDSSPTRQPLGAVLAASSRIVLLALCLVASGCEKGREEPPPPPPPPAPLCPDGRSLDPPRAEMRVAVHHFRQQAYGDARVELDRLAQAYPASASVRVWRGDSVLYDKQLSEDDAAERSVPYFREALALEERGCQMPEYEHYYARMGLAYAYLRTERADLAIQELDVIRERWPSSAEAHYHLARAYCLKREIDACVEHFQRTLEIARSLARPRFLRTHHSVEEWIRRSETQSEFPPLRADARYRKMVDAFTRAP